MMLFLKIVAAIFVAFLLLVLAVYLFICWKIRSVVNTLKDAMTGLVYGDVPPFRIKLRKCEPLEDPDDERFINADEVESLSKEYEKLGFRKIQDYEIDEIGTTIRVFVQDNTATYGVIYEHPVANVWCDIVRRYANDEGWTYATNEDHRMDRPPGKTQKFFPDQSLTKTIEQFQKDAPATGAIKISDEEFPRYFEQVYAEEMDWRIERNGPTEAEIRRVCEKEGTDCTPEHIADVQQQWREAISEYLSERALRSYRKQANLSRLEWEVLENQAVVIHERMQAEELLQAFDENYYPSCEEDAEDYEPDEQADFRKWSAQLVSLRETLTKESPQKAFRELLSSQQMLEAWDYQGAIDKPIRADIWIRPGYEEDDEEFDDD